MINVKRTGQPAAPSVPTALAKLHLREDLVDTDNDDYIDSLVAAATASCEDRLSRCLVSTEWVMYLDAFPSAIELTVVPVLGVSAVEYRDADGTWQTLNPADYVVDAVNEPGYVVPAPGKAWPATYPSINTVRVTYDAGYGLTDASVPAQLKQWVLLATADLYDRRSASAETPAVPQQFAEHLLDPFYRYEV